MIHYYTHEDWLEARKETLGGTDIGVLYGVNFYKSRYQLYMEKIGKGEDFEMNDAAQMGLDFEAGLVKFSARKHEAKVIYQNEDDRVMHVVHDSYPFLSCSPDSIFEITGERIYNECKTTKLLVTNDTLPRLMKSWIIQCNWNCGHLGIDQFIITYFSYPTAEVQFFYGEFDTEMYEESVALGVDFWTNHVAVQQAPDPTTGKDVEEYYQSLNDSRIEATEDIENCISHIVRLQKENKDNDAKIEYFKSQVKLFMLDKELLYSNNIRLASFKSGNRQTLDGKKLEKEYYDVYLKCLKNTPTRTFRLAQDL